MVDIVRAVRKKLGRRFHSDVLQRMQPASNCCNRVPVACLLIVGKKLRRWRSASPSMRALKAIDA